MRASRWVFLLFVLSPVLSLAQPAPGKPVAKKPPPPPTLAQLKAELAALADSGYPQQVACLRRFAQVKTEDCVRFLAEVRKTSPQEALRMEALRLMGQVGVPPAAQLLTQVLASGSDAERTSALMGLSSIRPLVEPEPFLSTLAAGQALTLRLQAAGALRSYPRKGVAERLADLLLEEPAVPTLRRAAESSLRTMAKEAALAAWWAEGALARRTPRRAALPSLLRLAGGCAESSELKDAMYAHLHAPEPAVRAAAADALGRLLGGKGSLAEHSQERLLALIKDPEPQVVLSAAVALGDIGPVGKSLDALLELGRARDPGLRALALSACRLSRDPRVLKLAKKGLGDKTPGVRAAAVAYLEALASKDAVDLLVAGLKKNTSGRMHAEILKALRVLTGADPGDDHKAWRAWWSLARDDHVLLSGGSSITAGARRSTGGSATRGVPTYYGSEVVSRRVTFVVDISGSMSARVGSDGPTRLEACKEQLQGVIGALPKQARFNLIWFESRFTPWQGQLVPAGGKQKAAALKAVTALEPRGGTNIFDPLEAALLDPEVDTIYLLSDGAPGSGKFVEAEAILREVRKLNATRRVAIHTISIGSQSALMKSLAQENGGQALTR